MFKGIKISNFILICIYYYSYNCWGKLDSLAKSFPYAGEMAKTIFALGIIGSGLITVPVLAGSSGYALSDVFGWKEGLSKKFRQAKGFYLIIAISTLVRL